MKKVLLVFVVMIGFVFTVNAQFHYNKDGTPDMRYKENKQIYGNPYSTPSYSTPRYSTPSYSTPSYSTPYSYPTYPNKKDGTPDMRYKENKQLYGKPYRY